jgi:drug/metabolite transporter (DMT)-like permease
VVAMQSRLRNLWQPRAASGRVAVLFMAASCLGWAIVETVFGRHLQRSYDVMQIVWMRYAVHLLVVFGIWGWHQPSRIWRTERPRFHLTRSLMMLIMPLSFAWGLAHGVTPGLTWSLFWLAPLAVTLIAIVWRRERPARSTWIGVALGLLGVIVIETPSIAAPPVASVAPFAMALSFSIYVVMTRFLRTEHLEANLFYTAFGVFAVLSFFMPSVWIAPYLHDVVMMVGIGTFGFVSLLLLDRAVSYAPLSDTSPALYSQVAFASIVGMASSGHRPSLHALAGIALIVVAGALAWVVAGNGDVMVPARRASSRV